MKKKSLPLWIAIALLVLLTICYVLLAKHNKNVADGEEMEETVLSVVAEDIVSASFLLEGQEETFVLEDGTWSLISDAEFAVEDSMIDLLVSNVTGMTIGRTLQDVTDLAEYGLDAPVQTMTLTDKGGNTYTLCWGNSNSVTGDDYCYVKENPSVVCTVDYSILQGFCETLEEYRQTETEEETATETANE